MKIVFNAFKRYLAGIWDDLMLTACALAPILMGLLFRFGIPALEGVLCAETGQAAVITPYNPLFDLLLATMTPMMFAFSGVLMVLEELDNGTARQMMVTPLEQNGYLLSRIGIPALIAVLYGIAALLVFGISGLSVEMVLLLTLLSAVYAVAIGMLVIAFAGNRVEGLALVKLCGLTIAGLPVAWFIHSPAAYVAGVLPTFWMTKLLMAPSPLYAAAALAVALVWITLLNFRFRARLR